VRKLKRCLKSLEAQTFKDFSVTVVADNGCVETKKAWGCGEFGEVGIICNEQARLPIRIWNSYLKDHPTCNLVYICDDVELMPDCLEKAMAHFAEDKLIGFKQIIKNVEGMCEAAMGIIGSKFADRFKDRQVFCPHYFNMSVDGELLDCAKYLGNFHFAEDAVLTHYHPGYYKEEEDSTHAIVRKRQQEDKKLRRERAEIKLIWGINEGV
jgi:hypothetical protein